MHPLLWKNIFGHFVWKLGPSPLKTWILQNPSIFPIIYLLKSKLKSENFVI